MKLSEHRMLRLKAVTPLFIGTGETIKLLSYIVDGSVVYVLDMDKFFERLSDRDRQRYLEWIEPTLQRISDIDAKITQARDNFDLRRQLQRQKREAETNLSIEHFVSTRLRTNPLTIARSCAAYSVRCNVRPGNDGFRPHIKDFRHRPYVPGTEIKGALRTSLLYALLLDGLNYDRLRKKLSDFRSFFRSGASPRDKVNKLRGIASSIEHELLRDAERRDDAKLDFLKLVEVSDSSPLLADSLRIELVQSLGTQRYTRTSVETIVRDSECIFRMTVGEDFAGQKRWALEKIGLGRLGDWLLIPKLLEACFLRSKEILDEDARYFTNQEPMRSLIHELQKQNQPTSPLIRFGAGQGFLGTTVALHVRKRDENLYDEAIREGVSFQRRWRTQRGNFPKTRRVVLNKNGEPISVLGWMKVEPG